MSRKIPFDIKYKPQIESGEYKVETRDGHEARIICWDACEDEPIVAVISGLVHQYALDGYANYLRDNDLFIITPEEDSTESESLSDKHLAKVAVIYSTYCKVEDGTRHAVMNWNTFRKIAQKFINIGRDETLNDLPRWIPNVYNNDRMLGIEWRKGEGFICYQGKIIPLKDLLKLPGFKEDEK